MIEFESVSKTFRDGTTAVDNLSLVIPSGKISVIVGPSGCGKTTTLRMVNRMLEPSKGKITWDDKPIKSRRKTTLRRQMGYVIQSGGLFPHRTVLENIATVPDLLKWDKQKSRKRATELLGSVGLDRKLGNRYPAQLSGGQQQRVGVARALAADPLVLLMDEPFSAVDPVVRSELHEFFLGLQRELSKTIIMITHDIDEAIKLGDQVAILRVGGRLAQVGTPQQLLDEPADAFVEGFVGRDRGYRSLSFQPASGLRLDNVQVVRDAASASGAAGPVLVVDENAQPVGWADPARPGAQIALGATFDPEADSLRTALDAALTSPVGLAVAVTGNPRRYAGVVDADMILRQVTQTRAQIAESIAVRTEGQPAGSTGAAEGTASAEDASPARDDQAPYEQGDQGSYDPDATSVRAVPPAETAATVGTVAAAGAVVHEADQSQVPESEVPESQIPESQIPDPEAHGTEGPEQWDARSEHPDAGDVSDDPDATRIAPPLTEQPADTDTGEPEVSPAPDAPEPYAFPPDAPASDTPASDATEPYGAEAPSTEDETVATAYDAQLEADEARAAAEQPDTEQSYAEQPYAEQPPADSDDHDREPPR